MICFCGSSSSFSTFPDFDNFEGAIKSSRSISALCAASATVTEAAGPAELAEGVVADRFCGVAGIGTAVTVAPAPELDDEPRLKSAAISVDRRLRSLRSARSCRSVRSLRSRSRSRCSRSLLADEVDNAAGLLALRFNEPAPPLPPPDGIPTGDASEIVVCEGNEAAMLAAATGVRVTLSKLGIESVEDLVLGLFISSCEAAAPIMIVFGSNLDK